MTLHLPKLYLPGKLGLQHGLSDACAGFLAGCWMLNQSHQTLTLLLLSYNLIAFTGQPLLALIPEKYFRTGTTTALLCSGFSLFLYPASIWLSLLILSLGSCAFHVFAGARTLNEKNNRYQNAGWFIAPGVFGLFSGLAAGLTELNIFPYLLSTAILISIALSSYRKNHGKHLLPTSPKPGILFWTICLLLILLSIRSSTWIFYQLQVAMKPQYLIMLGLIVSMGKFFGGWLTQRHHWQKSTVCLLATASLTLSIASMNQSFLLLAFGLACLQSTTPALLVQMNQYLQRPAMSSALTLGLAVSGGGAFLWLLGHSSLSAPTLALWLPVFLTGCYFIFFYSSKIKATFNSK